MFALTEESSEGYLHIIKVEVNSVQTRYLPISKEIDTDIGTTLSTVDNHCHHRNFFQEIICGSVKSCESKTQWPFIHTLSQILINDV